MRQRRTCWLAAWVGRRHTDPGPPPTVTSPCPLHTASPRQPRWIQRIQTSHGGSNPGRGGLGPSLGGSYGFGPSHGACDDLLPAPPGTPPRLRPPGATSVSSTPPWIIYPVGRCLRRFDSHGPFLVMICSDLCRKEDVPVTLSCDLRSGSPRDAGCFFSDPLVHVVMQSSYIPLLPVVRFMIFVHSSCYRSRTKICLHILY